MKDFSDWFVIVGKGKIVETKFFKTEKEAQFYIDDTYIRPEEKKTMTLKEYCERAIFNQI